MPATLAGLHHVTAICSDAQTNIDFYTGVLGLRLVKVTVNFDDPASYHFYYGNTAGEPGTIMTFFAWPGATRGIVGPPAVTATAFAVSKNSLAWWEERLKSRAVLMAGRETRFGDEVLGFFDPDGMRLELVASVDDSAKENFAPWDGSEVKIENAVRGFHSVTISERAFEPTDQVLTATMGFSKTDEHENRRRYRAEGGGRASIVDIVAEPTAKHGRLGAGIVHHVAFRTADDSQQKEWQAKLADAGLHVSPVMDRVYFHSIYYREPAGVLFEIATDSPGFVGDESREELGTKLMLPPWMEADRAEIEKAVPAIRLPK